MAESISDLESDTSSVEFGPVSKSNSIEQANKRLESLQQENRVLRMELDTFRYKCKSLEEENKELKKARVTIQLMAEQQEEFISNTLLKKIQALKNEKEQLARNYEQEEEFLTNDLSRKLFQLRQEKCELEVTLEREQEYQVNTLMRRIEKLQADVTSKQTTLEQLKKDKVELENQLEQEQEALVNRLWKRMDKLETEKRLLQQKLDQPVSEPPSPRENIQVMSVDEDVAGNLVVNIQSLKNEVSHLQAQLRAARVEHKDKVEQYAEEEKHIREENVRLQRKLQMEIERREQLCRHLSESESSLEMDDERYFNEITKLQEKFQSTSGVKPRNVSSPIPLQPSLSRPLSPALFSQSSPLRSGGLASASAHCCSSSHSSSHSSAASGAATPSAHHGATRGYHSGEKFIKPNQPPPAHSHPSPASPHGTSSTPTHSTLVEQSSIGSTAADSNQSINQ